MPTAHARPVPRATRGFTLVELLVALAIVAAATAIALPAFTGGGRAELTAAARTVAAGLRQARGEAILARREQTLELDVEERSLGLGGEQRRRRLPSALLIELLTARSELDDQRRGAIRFFPDGSSTGGRVTLALGERRMAVDVAWLTGRVRILAGEQLE